MGSGHFSNKKRYRLTWNPERTEAWWSSLTQILPSSTNLPLKDNTLMQKGNISLLHAYIFLVKKRHKISAKQNALTLQTLLFCPDLS